jgi:NAD(P)-dependent dehydrogenase (short-subunit alcohol dehydrogenase family)
MKEVSQIRAIKVSLHNRVGMIEYVHFLRRSSQPPIGVCTACACELYISSGYSVHCHLISGRVPFEYFGAYCASKSALEMYSDVLRLEMCKYGVHVSVIEPAAFKTGTESSSS